MTGNIYHLLARTLLPLLILSLVSNLAILVSPLFMMQVLDRVIPSGNLATLALMGAIALVALAVQALVEACRDLTLGRLSRWTEHRGTEMAISNEAADQTQIITHVANYARFLNGPAASAALGAPWIPLFLLALWLLHPAFVGLLFLMLGILLSVRLLTQATSAASERRAAICSQQEVETLRAASDIENNSGLSMIARNLRSRFAGIQAARHQHIDQSESASITRSTAASLIRNAGQIAALGLGALLVTQNMISAGSMIAGSILMSKSYGTIEALFTQLPAIAAARSDFGVLSSLQPNADQSNVAFDPPSGALRVENLIVPRGGGSPPRLDRVSFALGAGECLAIVGSSGSGKSTLLHALSGIAPAPIGSVFFDENEIRGLNDLSLFRSIGYLPQRATFKTGTIFENISSFAPQPDIEKVVAAAQTAGVYGLISALPDSFETDLGRQPYLLSAGQTQRVALARCLYNEPKYLFLDEPNALLDADGERALGQTLLRLKRQGLTIIMVVHRSGILGLADKVLHMENGRTTDFGPKAEVLGRLGMGGRQMELPILQTSQSDLIDWVSAQFTRAGDHGFRHKAQIGACELFSFACETCPKDALQFAKFTFQFHGDTMCEMSMTTPATQDIEETSAAVRKNLNEKPGNLVHLTQNEVQLAKLSEMSEKFEIANAPDTTNYRLVLVPDDNAAEPNLENRAL